MTLGEIKENLEQDAADDHMLTLVAAAHQNAKDTLAELRDLARGIHPPVLDRGLGPRWPPWPGPARSRSG